jgi:ketosteroid isomerase-like protein
MTGFPKMSQIPFYQLVASGVDLASMFKSAVDAFNARNLTSLMDLCDDNVVVVRVGVRDHYCGKNEVSAYFADQFKIKPVFTPTTSDTKISSTGNVAHIIGDAEWTDYDPRDPQSVHVDCTVHYAFHFVNRGNGWLISSLWGASDDLLSSQS